MEKQKAHKASSEAGRTQGFLLGLILVLALLFVGLEYNSNNRPEENDDTAMEDLAEEMELLAEKEQEDMITVPAPKPASPAVTEELKVVDKPVETSDKITPNADPDAEDTGEAAAVKGKTDTKQEEAAQAQVQTEDDNPLHIRIVQQIPEFPGGMVELMKWLNRNLKYPVMAQRQKIEGKVVVSFIINKDGSITDAKVEKSVDPSLDREAMRVVRMMPKWKPGIENNQPCRTMFAIPIVFKL